MMRYSGGAVPGEVGLLGLLTWLVVVVDLALVGVLLWKQITKK